MSRYRFWTRRISDHERQSLCQISNCERLMTLDPLTLWRNLNTGHTSELRKISLRLDTKKTYAVSAFQACLLCLHCRLSSHFTCCCTSKTARSRFERTVIITMPARCQYFRLLQSPNPRNYSAYSAEDSSSTIH